MQTVQSPFKHRKRGNSEKRILSKKNSSADPYFKSQSLSRHGICYREVSLQVFHYRFLIENGRDRPALKK